MKAQWSVITEKGLGHFFTALKASKTQKGLHRCLTALKVFNTEKGFRHFLTIFKVINAKKGLYHCFKVFNTEKELHHFLMTLKDFNTEKGCMNFLRLLKFWILKKDTIISLKLLQVLILKSDSITFLWLLTSFKIAILYNAGERCFWRSPSYNIFINELDLLWVPNFIALRMYFLFRTKFSEMRELIFVLMSNMCFLAIKFWFSWWLFGGYCLLPSSYYCLQLVTWWLLLIPTFSMNAHAVPISHGKW